MQSRVHIAVKYETLNEKQTLRIFRGFVEQYRAAGMVEASEDDIECYVIDDLQRKHFDGRQLRNIVSSAMGYARAKDNSKLGLRHIKRVVNQVEDFQRELAGKMREYQNETKAARMP